MEHLIKTGSNYELRADVREYAPDLWDFSLYQCFPEAQRPRWQRLLQLNLNRIELATLAAVINKATA